MFTFLTLIIFITGLLNSNKLGFKRFPANLGVFSISQSMLGQYLLFLCIFCLVLYYILLDLLISFVSVKLTLLKRITQKIVITNMYTQLGYYPTLMQFYRENTKVST